LTNSRRLGRYYHHLYQQQ